MSRLTSLRSRLATLGAVRWFTRWSAALAMGLAVALWALGVIFLLDFAFELTVLQRVIVIGVSGAIAAFSIYYLAAPLLAVRETWAELALLVEKQEGIESDVIAALQFESVGDANWGSTQLSGAVVDYVSQWSSEARVLGQANAGKMWRWLAIAAVTVLVVVLLAVAAPEVTRVFLARLGLGGEHYPTAVTIEQVAVNQTIVLNRSEHGAQPVAAPIPENSSATFAIDCSGQTGTADDPLTGVVRLRGANMSGSTELPLRFVGKLENSQAQYETTLDTLLAEAEYQVRLGDAWTEWAPLRMVELPAIEVTWNITPPSYASSASIEPPEPGARRISVLEGSRIEPIIDLQVNDSERSIASAELSLTAGQEQEIVKLHSVDEANRQWQVSVAGTPLESVAQPWRMKFLVEDSEGLKPDRPVEAYLRIRPDRPPVASARVVHRAVLPGANPLVEYSVNDDFGVAKAWLEIQVQRESVSPADDISNEPDASPDPTTEPTDPSESAPPAAEIVKRDLITKPIAAAKLPHSAKYELQLEPLRLIKGDHLKITLHVVDFRGENKGVEFIAESFVLEITDESGVLAVIAESDEESEKRLTEIIQKQLGIGDSP